MAISQFMDQIGDWNPQLLRELRGRLTRKNLIITLCLSLGLQCIIYWMFRPVTALPLQESLPAILTILLIWGSYLLSYDLSKEYRQRTIEFIRLTPQSSQEILIGKLLGVPILIYVAILAPIPLQMFSYLGRMNPLMLPAFYIPWIIKGWLLYSLSLLYSLTILKQRRHQYSSAVIAGSAAFITLILSRFNLRYYLFSDNKWYGISLTQSHLSYSVWSMAILIMVGYFVWRVLNRQFQHPQATLISKKQSYQMTLFINLFLLGFMIHSDEVATFTFIWLFAVLPIFSLTLMTVLFPNNQSLLDWARYGHLNRQKGVWQDLIWGKNSPPIIAVVINALIPTMIWISFLFLNPSPSFDSPHQLSFLQLLLSPLITITIILIYALISQILMLNSSSKAKVLTTVVLATLLIMPPLLAIMFKSSVFWLLSLFPMMGLYKGSTVAYFISLGLQLSLLGLLTAKLKQQIYLVGASETQTLCAEH